MASLNDVTGLAGQSRASYIAMLKIQYAKMWDDHVHQASKIIQRIATKKGNMGGERTKAVYVAAYPQSAGISAREGVRLPTARVGDYVNPELVARDIYTLLQWTGNAERAAAAGDTVAFAKPRTRDLEDARKQFDINMAIKSILGNFEIRAKCASVASSPEVLTLYSRNSRTGTTSTFWNSGRNYLRKNMSVNFATVAGGTATYANETTSGGTDTNERYISAVGGTDSAPTATLDSAAPSPAPTTDDHVIPFKSRATTTYSVAADDITKFASFNGLFNAATDDTYYSALYGLAKSTYTTLKGVYKTNPAAAGTTRPFEERLVHVMVDLIRDNGTGNEPDFLYLHSSTRREVVAEHADDRRYAPILGASGFQQLVAHVGDKALPYESDFLMLPGMVAAVNSDSWGWIEQSGLNPIDSASERWVEGYDAHTIIWHKSGNIECQRPFDNGVLDDIDFDVTDVNV